VSNLALSLDALSPASEAPPFRMPVAGRQLLWNQVRLYREIVYLARNPDNNTGGCWARNQYFIVKRKFNCSDATLRRWLETLVECGWIRRVVRGPNRLLIPDCGPCPYPLFLPAF
jgi:hypothetical protein